jgi:Rrf2 family protein
VTPTLSISEAASLALHAMALLASPTRRNLSAREMASALRVSSHHLSKVMQRLARAGLVDSVRGPHGGFKLARRAEAITLLQIYEAIEGELPTKQSCLLHKPACSGKCILGGLMSQMSGEMRDYLARTTLESLGWGLAKGLDSIAPQPAAAMNETINC